MIFIGQLFQYQFAFGCLGLGKIICNNKQLQFTKLPCPTSKLGGQKIIIHFQMLHDVTN